MMGFHCFIEQKDFEEGPCLLQQRKIPDITYFGGLISKGRTHRTCLTCDYLHNLIYDKILNPEGMQRIFTEVKPEVMPESAGTPSAWKDTSAVKARPKQKPVGYVSLEGLIQKAYVLSCIDTVKRMVKYENDVVGCYRDLDSRYLVEPFLKYASGDITLEEAIELKTDTVVSVNQSTGQEMYSMFFNILFEANTGRKWKDLIAEAESGNLKAKESILRFYKSLVLRDKWTDQAKHLDEKEVIGAAYRGRLPQVRGLDIDYLLFEYVYGDDLKGISFKAALRKAVGFGIDVKPDTLKKRLHRRGFKKDAVGAPSSHFGDKELRAAQLDLKRVASEVNAITAQVDEDALRQHQGEWSNYLFAPDGPDVIKGYLRNMIGRLFAHAGPAAPKKREQTDQEKQYMEHLERNLGEERGGWSPEDVPHLDEDEEVEEDTVSVIDEGDPGDQADGDE